MLCVIWCSVANRTNHPEQQSTCKAGLQPCMRSPFGAGRISGRDTRVFDQIREKDDSFENLVADLDVNAIRSLYMDVARRVGNDRRVRCESFQGSTKPENPCHKFSGEAICRTTTTQRRRKTKHLLISPPKCVARLRRVMIGEPACLKHVLFGGLGIDARASLGTSFIGLLSYLEQS